jgi:transposase InsO family protein
VSHRPSSAKSAARDRRGSKAREEMREKGYLQTYELAEKLTAELGRRVTVSALRLDRSRFETQAEAKMAIFDFIEGWYNPHRRHSSIAYLSPVNYERRICPTLTTSHGRSKTEARSPR